MLELPLKRCVQDVAMTLSDSATSAEPRELVRLSTDALREFRDRERARYEAIKARAMPFNLARGKPATEQVALANQLLTAVATPEQCWTEDGNDCRNYYGSPQGLIEVRRLFAPMLGAPPELVLVANNSSLALMHAALVYALLTGASDGAASWRDQHRPIRFLCPSPGYDRHFQICEQYGIEMIAVPLTGAGPDMDEVERLAADPAVKGMWCVPKYSSPTGETYSSETVARLARMGAAGDFRLFWDNAYAVHDLTGRSDRLDNVLDACAEPGPGAGVRLDLEDHFRAGWSRHARDVDRQYALVRLAPVDTYDRAGQAQPAAPCPGSARRCRDISAYGAAAPSARAEIRGGAGSIQGPARRHRSRGLDPAARRLFREP